MMSMPIPGFATLDLKRVDVVGMIGSTKILHSRAMARRPWTSAITTADELLYIASITLIMLGYGSPTQQRRRGPIHRELFGPGLKVVQSEKGGTGVLMPSGQFVHPPTARSPSNSLRSRSEPLFCSAIK